MAESPSQTELPNRFQPIFDALASAGFADAQEPDVSYSDKLVGALVWCVAALKPSEDPQFDAVRIGNLTQEEKMHANRLCLLRFL